MKEMMVYITSKVHSDLQETVSCIDPFADDKVALPLKSSVKGDSFFDRVLAIEKEKSSLRGF